MKFEYPLNRRHNYKVVLECVFTLKKNICHTGHKQREVKSLASSYEG